jgi:hypothetical protein
MAFLSVLRDIDIQVLNRLLGGSKSAKKGLKKDRKYGIIKANNEDSLP